MVYLLIPIDVVNFVCSIVAGIVASAIWSAVHKNS